MTDPIDPHLRIEMHEFLAAAIFYCRRPITWMRTYEEMTAEILKESRCKTLLEAIVKAKIDRATPSVTVRLRE